MIFGWENMTKISAKATVLLLFFSLCAPLLTAQTENNADNGQSVQNSVSSSGTASENAGSEDLFSNWNQTAEAVQPESPSSIGLFIRMVLVLALVVAAIYGIMLVLKKGMKVTGGDDDDPFLRKVSQVTLSPGKSVQIVTLFNHAYLVGVTDGSINLLGEITDSDLVDSMNLYADQHATVKKPRTFADILNIFMPGGASAEGNASSPNTTSSASAQGGATNVFTNSAESAAEELQRQRDRLNGERP